MSESMNMPRGATRKHLLTSVSTMVLIASVCAGGPAFAGSAGEAPLWIELGSHAETIHDSNTAFSLPFGSAIPPGGLSGPLVGGVALLREFGDDAGITFRPENSDWVFSASVTYGRARGKHRAFHQSQPVPTTSVSYYRHYFPSTPAFNRTATYPAKITADTIDADTVGSESHLMIDFAVGKDVGLGIFGRHGTSTLSAGVRFAQLNTVVHIARFSAIAGVHASHFLASTPTCCSGYIKIVEGNNQVWDNLTGKPQGRHEFRGVGPSISWTASAPIAGSTQNGLSLDWGINAALLFGKQKTKAQHRTHVVTSCYVGGCASRSPYDDTSRTEHTKTVTVPNLGGFAGFSYRVEDVKISLGYRADFFFHALDTGIAGQHSDTRGFYGPFASLSFGLGD